MSGKVGRLLVHYCLWADLEDLVQVLAVLQTQNLSRMHTFRLASSSALGVDIIAVVRVVLAVSAGGASACYKKFEEPTRAKTKPGQWR